MGKSGLLCLLLGALAWGQAAPGAPAEPKQASADAAAAIPDSAPVVTVEGVCPPRPKAATAAGATAKAAASAKTSAADCKTVITKEEFEAYGSALSPVPLNPQQKKLLAARLGQYIPLAEAARKKGLDKSAQYAQAIKFYRLQTLASEMASSIQKEAANVPEADIEKYYKDNPAGFEQFSLERLYVPRTKQVEPEAREAELKDESNEKPTEEQQKAKEAAAKAKGEANEQEMTKLADSLRARAVAGEDFAKLQKEAFESAGMKMDSPNVTLPKMRRTGLPPAQASVFDLKVGEVSPVISDSGGHYIYKVDSQDEIPLDQAQNEIHYKLQTDRGREMMEKLTGSVKTTQNDAYFGGGAPGMGQRMMPHPANAPSAPQPQTPPAAPAPTPKPN